MSPARKAVVSPRKQLTLAALMPRLAPVLTAGHRQAPPWPLFRQGTVRIAKTEWMANGFSRWMHFDSDGPPLPKHANLRFEAQVAGVSGPVEVYWQVVNSGAEAATRNGLRGGFDRGSIEQGTVKHRESTLYSGTHTIECLVVKDRYLVARSGPFVVNIR